MMVTIGYIIIGVKFFIIYIFSLIIGFFLYTGRNIYIHYKRTKEKDYDVVELKNVLILYGYINYVQYIFLYQILDLRYKTSLVFCAIKFQKDFFFNSIKRKFGAKQATKYHLSINGAVEVIENDLILVDKKINTKEKILISKYKFTTDFHLKNLWYISGIPIIENKSAYFYSFYNTIDLLQKYENLLQFKFLFIKDVMGCFFLEDDFEDEQKEKKERFNKF
jgi:hypothetical protein